MVELTGFQRNFLRKKAHHLRPVVMIGKNGLSGEVIAAGDKALDDHELIKIKFINYKEDKQAFARTLAEETRSLLIAVIGNTAILYRENKDPEKKEIYIPGIHADKKVP